MSNFQRWKGIMKAVPFEEKRLLKWSPPFIVQPKYDGIRCRAIPLENGEYLLLSSEENPIFSVPHINKSLNKLNLGTELDGELYCHGMSFEEIVSITSRTVNLHENRSFISFHIFDVVNQEPQVGRLLYIVKNINLMPHLIVAPYFMCNSLDDIMKVYDNLIKQGYEGIIVRHLNNYYERKRSTWIMKFKPKKEDIYESVGWAEEVSISGTPKGTLGSIICKSGDGNTFNIGTGFSEEKRKDLWASRNELIGKQIKVQYQHLTDRKVPRFPVFIEIINNKQTN